jgi:hypothetical protein
MAMAAKTYAVGTLWLENYTADKAVFKITQGTKLAEPAFVSLYAGMPGETLTQIFTTASPYDFAGDPGYFDAGVVQLGTLAGNANLSFRVDVWTGSRTAPVLIGQSLPWTQQAGTYTPTEPPTPPTGPSAAIPNNITLVPEPSTIALGLLGLGALLIRRRK